MDYSEEMGARLSAERDMATRDRRERRGGGRGVRRPGALLEEGWCLKGFDTADENIAEDEPPRTRRRRRRRADRMAAGEVEEEEAEVRNTF